METEPSVSEERRRSPRRRSISLLGRALSFFPALHLVTMTAALVALAHAPSAGTAIAVMLAVYGLPLCAFRLLSCWQPLREGVSFLDEPRFSPWWGGHQIQAVFIAIPQLESLLQLIPGAFSLWLRLWGSEVGRSVYWTPRVEIADRSLLVIGDAAIVGHKVEMYAHAVRSRRGRPLLHIRRIVIGRGAFLGAGTRIGPGVHIADGARVPALSDLYPHRRVNVEWGLDGPPRSSPQDRLAPAKPAPERR